MEKCDTTIAQINMIANLTHISSKYSFNGKNLPEYYYVSITQKRKLNDS